MYSFHLFFFSIYSKVRNIFYKTVLAFKFSGRTASRKNTRPKIFKPSDYTLIKQIHGLLIKPGQLYAMKFKPIDLLFLQGGHFFVRL